MTDQKSTETAILDGTDIQYGHIATLVQPKHYWLQCSYIELDHTACGWYPHMPCTVVFQPVIARSVYFCRKLCFYLFSLYLYVLMKLGTWELMYSIHTKLCRLLAQLELGLQVRISFGIQYMHSYSHGTWCGSWALKRVAYFVVYLPFICELVTIRVYQPRAPAEEHIPTKANNHSGQHWIFNNGRSY